MWSFAQLRAVEWRIGPRGLLCVEIEHKHCDDFHG